MHSVTSPVGSFLEVM